MIKIDFEMNDGTYFYRDAIHLPEDHTFTDADIEQIKQDRFNNWITIITTPPVEQVVEDIVDPTIEQPVEAIIPENIVVSPTEEV